VRGRLRALQSGRAQDALYALVVGVILLAWLALVAMSAHLLSITLVAPLIGRF
jgi:hypothetical protein